jgi:hypothetical protein
VNLGFRLWGQLGCGLQSWARRSHRQCAERAELCPTSSNSMVSVRTQTCHLLTKLHRHDMRQGALLGASSLAFCQWHCELASAPVSLAAKQSAAQPLCARRCRRPHLARPMTP